MKYKIYKHIIYLIFICYAYIDIFKYRIKCSKIELPWWLRW